MTTTTPQSEMLAQARAMSENAHYVKVARRLFTIRGQHNSDYELCVNLSERICDGVFPSPANGNEYTEGEILRLEELNERYYEDVMASKFGSDDWDNE